LFLNADYTSGQVNVPPGGVVKAEPGAKLVKQDNTGNGLAGGSSSNVNVSNLAIDMGYDSRGLTNTNHGLSFQGNNITVNSVTVTDFAYNGTTGGGSGALFFPTSGKLTGLRLRDSNFVASPNGQEAFGWIFVDADTSFATNLYSANAIGGAVGTGYAHELKNNCQFNYLGGLIANYSSAALAYGQDTVGVDGADKNMAVGIVAKNCGLGLLIGEGQYNATLGLIHDPASAPTLPTNKFAIRYEGSASYNAAWGVMSVGAPTAAIRYNLDVSNCYTQVAAMGVGTILEATAGARRNVTEISHPGDRNFVTNSIVDASGSSLKGPDANVVISHATGERIGSLSGHFKDTFAPSLNAQYLSGHAFRHEDTTATFIALANQGNTNDQAGISYNTPSAANLGAFFYAKAAIGSNDYWALRTNSTEWLRFFQNLIRPTVDNGPAIGSTSFRFSNTYSTNLRPGAGSVIWTSGTGSPEGVITAAVGSMYTRTDGGVGTTLYVKETGAGNTGWAAK
jgi:hypothetical protein